MAETKEEIRARLVSLLAEFTGNEELKGANDETLLGECGLDSLSLFHFVLEIEKRFDLTIPDHAFTSTQLQTVGGIVGVLHDARTVGAQNCNS